MSTTTPNAARTDLVPAWEQPDDARMFWAADRVHFPYPISRLDDDVMRLLYREGMNPAYELYDIPARADARRFWTYHYVATVPLPLSPEELQETAAGSQEKIGQAMGQLRQRWEDDWLPAIEAHIAHFEGFDLTGAPDAELIAHVEDTFTRIGQLWFLHFQIVMPSYLAMSLFEELYRELFDESVALRPYQLLQGFDNKTVETGDALWRLSRRAAASRTVRAAFEQFPPHGVIPALESSFEGQEFLAYFHQFLSEYGQRGETWGLNYPSWIEDPTPVIRNIRDYIGNPDHNPEHDQAVLVAERERLVAQARMALASYPEAVRGQFEFLLAAAQMGMILSEDHNFWIDFKAMYHVRRVFMELGRRFVKAGVLTSADDIFHLSFDEVLDTARYLPRLDRRELVASRRAEMEHYSTITPPPAVGTPPAGAPPDDAGARTLAKFLGAPPPVSEDRDVLYGAAGSSGVARGPARVIRDIADAARLRPGDIMVTATTAPPWTPLFATVAAVVTDTGGVLSHCAVVAREYRIPAVVGTGFATQAIADGQLIEVDGDNGIVRVIRNA